jgi:hypothetical protein
LLIVVRVDRVVVGAVEGEDSTPQDAFTGGALEAVEATSSDGEEATDVTTRQHVFVGQLQLTPQGSLRFFGPLLGSVAISGELEHARDVLDGCCTHKPSTT